MVFLKEEGDSSVLRNQDFTELLDKILKSNKAKLWQIDLWACSLQPDVCIRGRLHKLSLLTFPEPQQTEELM